MSTKSQAHYYSNLEYYRKKRRESRNRRREIVIQAKSKPCADCGIQYNYWIMQFDHLGDKKFGIGRDWTNVRLSDLLDEIAKCDVVCANCHADRTYNRVGLQANG